MTGPNRRTWQSVLLMCGGPWLLVGLVVLLAVHDVSALVPLGTGVVLLLAAAVVGVLPAPTDLPDDPATTVRLL